MVNTAADCALAQRCGACSNRRTPHAQARTSLSQKLCPTMQCGAHRMQAAAQAAWRTSEKDNSAAQHLKHAGGGVVEADVHQHRARGVAERGQREHKHCLACFAQFAAVACLRAAAVQPANVRGAQQKRLPQRGIGGCARGTLLCAPPPPPLTQHVWYKAEKLAQEHEGALDRWMVERHGLAPPRVCNNDLVLQQSDAQFEQHQAPEAQAQIPASCACSTTV